MFKITISNPAVRIVALLFTLLVALGSSAQSALAGNLDIRVSNAISGAVLTGLAVHAMEEGPSGDLTWRMADVSDSSGELSLELPGLGQGTNYVLVSVPYNGGYALSSSITSAGSYEYRLGAVEITAFSGVDGSTLGNHRVGAFELLADGSSNWAAEGTTDANGIVRLDVPGLSSGKRYTLYSFRPGDGSYFLGQEVTSAGQYQLHVGHPQLRTVVLDHLSGEPLTEQEVYLLKLSSQGEREFVGVGVTDNTGLVEFEHAELGLGATFELATQAFSDMPSFSEHITAPGEMTWRIGKLRVEVVSGVDGTPLVNQTVGAMERLTDGTDMAVAQGTTDSSGHIRFDLQGLGSGRNYVIYAHSPVDNSLKKSPLITANGITEFTVGAQPLNVKLTNVLTGESLADRFVYVLLVGEDGSKEGIALGITDENGNVSFDVSSFAEGKTIQLMSQPYNGGWVLSDPITQPGETQFSVGGLPVRLRDSDLNVDLPGHSLTLLERLDNGELAAVAYGTTDEQGRVTFDALGLNTGSSYSVIAENIFGLEKQYFSPWIVGIGAIDFSVSREGDFDYDVTEPELSVLAPNQNHIVSAGGFLIHGTVSDNISVAELLLEVDDESVGTTIIPVAVDNGRWSHVVPGDALSPSENLNVTVRASDRIGNETAVQLSLNSVQDNLSPSLVVQSHQDQDTVSSGGFLLTGFASDNVDLRDVTATVIDSSAGQLMVEREIEVASNSGSWALVVDQLTAGGDVQLNIVARDFDGHEASTAIALHVVSPAEGVGHTINRITFGATAQLLDETRGQDAATFIAQQLNPAAIDESVLEAMFTDMGTPQTAAELQDYQTVRAIYAKRQLLEKMTWFWDNHFNTYLGKSGSVDYEFRENEQFRTHALGKFRDLLQVSATSPAMIIYLDNYTNYFTGPNENYARELLELHTLGVNAGYTEADVVEVARVFTGWSMKDDDFHYLDAVHDTGSKSTLGASFDGSGGQAEGMELLDILAAHPSTAAHICTKLQRFLVSDEPAAQDVADCANVFLNSDGDIGQVVSWILYSPAFSAAQQFKNKVKTPLEFMAGLARATAPEMSQELLRSFLWMLGMPSFYCAPPDGWSEQGSDWINSTQLWTRTQAATAAIFNTDMAPSMMPGMSASMYVSDPVAWFVDRGYETEDAVLGYLVELVGSETFSGTAWEEARKVLRGQESYFDIHGEASDVGFRLKAASAIMLSAPDYHLQ